MPSPMHPHRHAHRSHEYSPCKNSIEHPQWEKATSYARVKISAMPPIPFSKLASMMIRISEEALAAKIESVENEKIDRGIAELLDAGLRCLVGLNCPVNKVRARLFLTRATALPAVDLSKDNKLKAIAHALLVECLEVTPRPGAVPPSLQAVHEAASHAAKCVYLNAYPCGRTAGAPSKGRSPAPSGVPEIVLPFLDLYKKLLDRGGLEPLEAKKDLGEMYEEIWQRVDKARKEVDYLEKDEEMRKKWKENPARYKCAAEECEIFAASGAALFRCAGKCVAGFKPSYCSQECQRKDWPRHRTYCLAGNKDPICSEPFKLTYEEFKNGREYFVSPKNQRDFDFKKNVCVTKRVKHPSGRACFVTGLRESLDKVIFVTEDDLVNGVTFPPETTVILEKNTSFPS